MNKLRIAATLGAALSLAGCDKLGKGSQSEPENGRYAIVTLPKNGPLDPTYRAWRIDTVTGELGFCTVVTDRSNEASKDLRHGCVGVLASE